MDDDQELYGLAALEGMFVNVRLMMYTGDDEDGQHMMTAVAHSSELSTIGVIGILKYTVEALEKEVASGELD